VARPRPATALAAGTIAGLAALALAFAALELRRDVRRALDAPSAEARPLQLVPLAPPVGALPTWTAPEVDAVAFPRGELVTAGRAGVRDGRGDLSGGLATRWASALSLWAGDLVVALHAGGLAVRRGGAWSEMRTGWGTLHARTVVEAPGGELLIGAREGLFRARVAAARLERLDRHPVRAVAPGPGFVMAGGEEGLVRVAPGRTSAVTTPDPWIEAIALDGDDAIAVTAAGLARGPREGPLSSVRGGETVASAALHEGQVFAVTDPPGRAVLVFGRDGLVREEALTADVRRVMTASGLLFADAEDGLHRRDVDGWKLVVPRTGSLPAGAVHVTALARFRGRLVAGFFDGGLATATPHGDRLEWEKVAGTAVWGVNALLATGGELFVASLRGAARYDGAHLVPIEGPGAAFSLAATRDGVAIGYGQGVRLGGGALLSAFHGLPGNQALALVETDALFVATPSGLGAVAGHRVLWRVTAGEGKLPHPWVTALAPSGEGLLVGTWGGGLVRRVAGDRLPAPGVLSDTALYLPFVETEGLAVSPGAIAVAGGRAFVGTDASGLWMQSRDGARFERVPLPLPSPRVSALFAEADALWVGTDEGLVRVPLGPDATPMDGE
jgi:hypothetical protein